jgi:hypothetical protein
MARRGAGAGGGGGYFVNDPRHGGDQHGRAAVWDPTELGQQAARAIEQRGTLLDRGTSMPRDFAVASGRGSPSYSFNRGLGARLGAGCGSPYHSSGVAVSDA